MKYISFKIPMMNDDCTTYVEDKLKYYQNHHSKLSTIPKNHFLKSHPLAIIFIFINLISGHLHVYRKNVPFGKPFFIKLYYFLLRFINIECFTKSDNWGFKNHKLPFKN